MKRGYKFKHRKYIGYFIYGFILAALAFGSIGIKLARPDTSEPVQCEPFSSGICEPSRIENCQPFYHPIRPECNPDRMSKDYIRECWKGGPPCLLDAANSRDNDTIRRKTDEE